MSPSQQGICTRCEFPFIKYVEHGLDGANARKVFLSIEETDTNFLVAITKTGHKR